MAQPPDRTTGDPSSPSSDRDELHDLPDLTSAPSRRNSQYVRMHRHGEGISQSIAGGNSNNQPFVPPNFTPYTPHPHAVYGSPYGPSFGPPHGAPYPPVMDIRRNPTSNSNSNQEDTTLALSRGSSIDHNTPGFPIPNTNAPSNANVYPNVTPYASVPQSQSQTPYHSQPGSASASMYNGSYGGDKSGYPFYEFEFEGGPNPNPGSNYPPSAYNGSVMYPPSHAFSHAPSYSVDANAQAQVLAQQRAQRQARRQSTSSRVSYDYFDPQGMSELVRKLSTMERSSSSARGKKSVSIEEQDRAAVVDIGAVRRSPSLDSSSVTHGSDKAGPIGGSPGEKEAMVLAGVTPAPDKAPRKVSFDLELTLRAAIVQREAQHISARSLGILFKDLRVTGLAAGSAYQPTLGSMLNPMSWLERFSKMRHPDMRDIISGFEGTVRPGEMLLVLGRPGSGCSTLLKTLANHTDEYISVTGERHYDSLSPRDIREKYRGDVTYCPEDDIHFPSLTVRETLEFAAKTRAPNVRLGDETRVEYSEHMTDILMTIFGLRHAQNTPVGDANLRGVSGGEKKRVSISEALAARSLLGCWDNSTRGLDASTALEFVRALRIATDLAQLTTVVSIYQAGEALYKLFDKVCVIGEGKMYYFGRADEAREHFERLGYRPSPRQTTADFLVSVTDPNGRIMNPEHPYPIPRTPEDFVRAFHNSPAGHSNRVEMMAYWHEYVGRGDLVDLYATSAQAEHSKCAPENRAYTISLGRQLSAVMLRRWQIMKGSKSAQFVQLFSFIAQAIVMGTTFLNTPNDTSSFFSRGGIMYFCILFGAITAMAEIPALYSQRPIVNRHHKAAMYHPFIEALALTLVDVPLTIVTQAVFAVIVYFLVGLQRTAPQFFIFYLLVTLMTLTMKAFYRALAAAFEREAGAQAMAGVLTLLIVLYTGYTIPKPTMVEDLQWLTWLSPLRYGFEAIMTNEFHTIQAPCVNLIPIGPGYENISLDNQVCTTVGSVSGQVNVDGNRFLELMYDYNHDSLWTNVGAVVAFGIFFIAALLYFTERNTASAANTAMVLFKRGSRCLLARLRRRSDREHGSAFAAAIRAQAESESKQDLQALAAMKEQKPMTDVFTWRNLKYTVPVDGGERLLLNDVSGYVAPGKLTALMGESGAGKTTLLNVLAGRYGTGVVTGDLLVNGHPLPSDFQSQTGYCQQMDTHIAEQTVREALFFSAILRQPQSVPLAEKEAYAETCLKMCGLESYADAIVGTLGVEQRKRTTIGVELAAKPKLLLFLDEPTSGLDSQSALAICKFLRELAAHGQAVLCTIHQPSAELFEYFDRLLLLQKGGKTAYFGDLGGHCSTLIDYFEKKGARTCADEENPAEWMLDIIGAGATATSETDWHAQWIKSAEINRVQQQIDDLHNEGRKRPPVPVSTKSGYQTSWIYQFIALLCRELTSYWRNPIYLLAKLILNILAGLFIGFTFFEAPNTIQGTQNKLFAIFMATIVCIPISNQLQVLFIETRRIYEVRERPSQMYSWTALVTAQFLTELPWNILSSLLLFVTWYWTVGFDPDRAGYSVLMMGVVFPLYYTSFAQAVAAMAPNAQIAALLFSLAFSFVGTFNGVMQPFNQLGWWQWMYYLSPFTYLIEGLLGQAVGGQQISCSDSEFATVQPPDTLTCGDYMNLFVDNFGGYLANPDDSRDCRYCAIRTADQFLETGFNIFYRHRWRDFGIVMGVSIFNLFCLFAFTYFFRIRKGSLFGRLVAMFRRRRS